jgi:hypothetical protein
MNNKIIFNIYLVNLSKQTSKVTATFEITKNGIISPKAGEQIWFVMSENFQSNCNLEGYGKLTGGI